MESPNRLVEQPNFKQARPVLTCHKQAAAVGVVGDAVRHGLSVCAKAFIAPTNAAIRRQFSVAKISHYANNFVG